MKRFWLDVQCFFLGHDEVDTCKGDSCWYCARCGETWHDVRLEKEAHHGR